MPEKNELRIKRGSGVPSSLSEGELAFDLQNKILFVGDGTSNLPRIEATKVYISNTGSLGVGYYRIATINLATATRKNVAFRITGSTSSGTKTMAIIWVPLEYRTDVKSMAPTVMALTNHTYNSDTTAENGMVLRNIRVSINTTNHYAYIDINVYKTTTVTLVVEPLWNSDWVFYEGTFTNKDPSVPSPSSDVYMSNGFRANYTYANDSNSSFYSIYGIYSTSLAVHPTSSYWVRLGTVSIPYNASYLKEKSLNLKLNVREVSVRNISDISSWDDFDINLKILLPAHANSTEFQNAVPLITVEVSGKTTLNPETDIAALVTANSTSSKIISLCVKSKSSDVIYLQNVIVGRYGFSFNASYNRTHDFYYSYSIASSSTLPTPVQGSVAYGSWVKYNISQFPDGGNWNLTSNLNIGDILYIDKTNNRVGIKTSLPLSDLDVSGNVSADKYIALTESEPPLQVNSSKVVTNLNSDLLDGLHSYKFSTFEEEKRLLDFIAKLKNSYVDIEFGDTVYLPSPYTDIDPFKQVIHLSLLRVPEAEVRSKSLYRYYVAFTPYPFFQAPYENPCVCGSNDLETFFSNWTNPIFSGNYPTYANSDAELIEEDGVFVLFNRKVYNLYGVCYLEYKYTTNFTEWSNTIQTSISDNTAGLISPSIVKHDPSIKREFVMYYLDSEDGFVRRTITFSDDFSSLSAYSKTSVEVYDIDSGSSVRNAVWHSTVRKVKGGYVLLFVTAFPSSLWIGYSLDGLVFYAKKVFSASPGSSFGVYRGDFLVDEKGNLLVLLPVTLKGRGKNNSTEQDYVCFVTKAYIQFLDEPRKKLNRPANGSLESVVEIDYPLSPGVYSYAVAPIDAQGRMGDVLLLGEIRLSTGSIAKNLLSWSEVPGARKYRVFRGINTEAFVYFTEYIDTPKTSLTDDSSITWNSLSRPLTSIDGNFSINGFSENIEAKTTVFTPNSSGWYTIAVIPGTSGASGVSRGIARFAVVNYGGNRHQEIIFYVGFNFGKPQINVISHATDPASCVISKIRCKYKSPTGSYTYNGVALQVYVSSRLSTDNLQAFILGDNVNTRGWIIKDWIPDATDPGDLYNYSSFNTTVEVELTENVGIATSSQIKVDYFSGAPFIVASSTKVNNLNADLLDGKHWYDIRSGDTFFLVTPIANYYILNAKVATNISTTGTITSNRLYLIPITFTYTTRINSLGISVASYTGGGADDPYLRVGIYNSTRISGIDYPNNLLYSGVMQFNSTGVKLISLTDAILERGSIYWFALKVTDNANSFTLHFLQPSQTFSTLGLGSSATTFVTHLFLSITGDLPNTLGSSYSYSAGTGNVPALYAQITVLDEV